MLVRIALVLSLLASHASAQSDVLLLHTCADSTQRADLRAWVAAIRARLHPAHVRPIDPASCWPQDASCAVGLARSAHVDSILLVRVLWERAGSAPIHDDTGRLTGHRSLRVSRLDVTLIDAHGSTIAHRTSPAEVADADRPAAVASLFRDIGL